MKNQIIEDFARVMDDLITKYPGRTIQQIIADASQFTGRNTWGRINNVDLVNVLRSYRDGHD